MDLINTANTVTKYAESYESFTEATISILGAEALMWASLSAIKPGTIAKNMNRCCQVAAKIFRSIFATAALGIPTTTTTDTPKCLRDDIGTLKGMLATIDFVSWLEYAPEAYGWVCFTAAAASFRDENDWTSFILTPMPVFTAMDSAELLVLRDGWAYLRWLRDVSRGLTTDVLRKY
ncbi:hypothetical protein BJX63DRAFT_433437 [Aspergillus granulosus]|uniref:Uncharacterized protein n=1 Tax=Aspergillus granulosus TaxID=176169 RepID=A0ABR4H7J5_9EURO